MYVPDLQTPSRLVGGKRPRRSMGAYQGWNVHPVKRRGRRDSRLSGPANCVSASWRSLAIASERAISSPPGNVGEI